MIKSYVVRAGDHLAKIAHGVGLDADTVWNHSKNAALRKKRPDRNILCEGDVLFLPVEEDKPIPLKIGALNSFSATVPEIDTHLRFADANGPFANEPYLVEGLDGAVEGTTDGDGKLTITAPVPIRVVKVTFEKRGLTYSVLLGDMDPISEVSGVQARLKALGHHRGAATGELDQETEDAIRKFQQAKGLPVTGAGDPATLDALKAAFGC